MSLPELRSRDAVQLDGFEWPSALKEAGQGDPTVKAVRVSRQRGDIFATVTILNAKSDKPTPIVATFGDSRTTFGRRHYPVLTITAHGTEPEQLVAMLRNTADALERAKDLALQLSALTTPEHTDR